VRVLERNDRSVTLEFAIRDTGIGVAQDKQQHIFGAFSQAEASTTRRYGGTGLGLSISSRLVEVMGGALQMESEENIGSRFHFSLSMPLASSTDDLPVSDKPPHASVRVLVVDDNASARVVLRQLCESLAWDVDVAASGEQALELVAREASAGRGWQVVLMDWQMPGMDGWQASQRIRELVGPNGTTVVLMVTAYGRELLTQLSQVQNAMIDGFLAKPVTASQLYDTVCHAREGQVPVIAESDTRPMPWRLVGLRILVAEDNLTNQQVVRELLRDEGALVRIVGDGQAAVAAVEEGATPIDVILMDLQMPIMDGLDATRHIRSVLGVANLPIVAMTANALSSDREACLAAGMNEHIGKPIDMDHLVGMLRSLCPRVIDAPKLSAARTGTQALPAAIVRAAQVASIDIRAALNRMSGKLDIYRQLVRGQVAELDGVPARLREISARGDKASVLALMHSMSGQLATLGATALAQELSEAEKKLVGLTGRLEMAVAIAPVIGALEASQPGLRALLDVLEPSRTAAQPGPTTADAAQLRRGFESLASQLRQSDMAATETIAAIRRQCEDGNDPDVGRIEDAVVALDFETALRLCEHWLATETAMYNPENR
jgi:CheY-like chemotaxis protein/HPt (histidine-containing phosphotransfer) domain-containing protein